MYTQADLGTYKDVDCSSRLMTFDNLPDGVTQTDFTLTFDNG